MKLKKEIKEVIFDICMGISCILKTLLLPILLFFEIPRMREEKCINDALSRQFSLGQQLEKCMEAYYAYNIKLKNNCWPSSDEFISYGQTKKKMEHIYNEMEVTTRLFKAHLIKENEYKRKIEILTLEYLFRKTFKEVF